MTCDDLFIRNKSIELLVNKTFKCNANVIFNYLYKFKNLIFSVCNKFCIVNRELIGVRARPARAYNHIITNINIHTFIRRTIN